MASTESNGHKDGSQQEEPQTMGGPVESGDTSIVGDMQEEQLLDKMFYLRGDSNGGNIQGLPEWAIKRTAVGSTLPPKLLTLVIIHKDGKVLLGMKKRGFGKGYYNGFGGKVEKGETIEEAASRELQEEAGVTPVDMSKRGILTFHFDNDPIAWEVHVYHVSEILGEPCETEEMEPRWFTESEIPYETMWADDIIWYPEFLKGGHFTGSFYFESKTTLVAHSLQIISA
ncbi:unnamed protein product [Calypogeia fissa]